MNIIAYSLAQTPHQEVDPFGPYKRNLEYSESLNDSLDQLLQLCRQIAALSQQNEDTSGSDQMDHAMLLAQERYMDPGFSTNIAAQEVGLSITYFNRQFRRKTGQSYSTYLNNYRLNVASSLLCTTSLSMSRICQSVGLTNESYFYSLFKREFGVTPHQYRSLHKECKDQPALGPERNGPGNSGPARSNQASPDDTKKPGPDDAKKANPDDAKKAGPDRKDVP